MSGSIWNNFLPKTLTDAPKINQNFDWLEGDLVPQTAGVQVNNTHDAGSSAFNWRYGYFLNIQVNNTLWFTFDRGLALTSGSLVVQAGGANGSTSNAGSQQQIAQHTVSTPDIRADAVKAMTTTASGSLATGTTITTLAVTCEGGPLLIMAHATVLAAPDGSGVGDVTISLDRAGTGLPGGVERSAWTIVSDFTARAHAATIQIVDSPGAGTFNYNLRYTINTGSITSVSLYGLTAVEVKK